MGCECVSKNNNNNLKSSLILRKSLKGHKIYMSKDIFKKTICEIIIDNGYGTGFISKIKYKNDYIICLLTNHHVLSEDIIKAKENIQLKFNNSQKYLDLKLKRKIFYNKDMDYICIEILQEDNIQYEIIDIDDNCYNNSYNKEKYNGKNIIASGIGIDKEIKSSEGNISYIDDDDKFYHSCHTEEGYSGGPIILINTKKIIGIHCGNDSIVNKNVGIYMNDIIKDINKIEINSFYKIINNYTIRIFGEEFVKNNKNHCKIIYENKEYELSEYFTINLLLVMNYILN